MGRRVTQIPATKPVTSAAFRQATATRRVAAYARVSTASEEQATSYEAQVGYYTEMINSRVDWELAGIYTDEGITGTSTKHREGFKRMVADALAGQIDLIVTKSVSRFARNTVDSLTTVRELKEAGVEIFFEKENIWTLDAKGELLITIMSSLAQEESRSISENVRWGIKKRFADGQVFMPYPNFLGYDKGPDGRPQVNEDEAKVVRRIYRMFLSGYSANAIATTLTNEGSPSPGHTKGKWHAQVVDSILRNEKYKGDALLQKTYITDFLTKKQVKNQGEVAQYYVTGSHEAIIDPDTWDLVQAELASRKRRRGIYPFTQKLKCSVCGAYYGSKVWHSNDPYRSMVWQCNNKYKVEHPKSMPHPRDEEIQAAFNRALSKYVTAHPEVAQTVQSALDNAMNTEDLEAEQATTLVTIEGLTAMMDKEVQANTRIAQDQQAYRQRFAKLEDEFTAATTRYDELTQQIAEKQARAVIMRNYLDTLADITAPVELFDRRLWHVLIDHGTIEPDGSMAFTFKDGTTISA
ncbi:prophage resolvase [Corynebacterium resistens DSM 45100]|uniref:Prophage resolvase n=1 Tax=Corynebacterium resistens (strain DSM 45100 / JCM 12819 / GTC 2026 / SICGH 158) TaxID=662755 RepID=F8E155_CORRG|nr:recombinase family protein [Corynebacterium resistens]AEI09219.1 prophage resolvase [Corynebacterium resistens DSM 45100]